MTGSVPAQGDPPGRYELLRRLGAFEVARARFSAARPRALEALEGATSAYRQRRRIPAAAMLSVAVIQASGKGAAAVLERPIKSMPLDFEIEVRQLEPGDHRLRAEITTGVPGCTAVLEQVLSVARDPRNRPLKWPIASPCAGPAARIKGRRGVKLELVLRFVDGKKHLPIVEVKRAA